MTWGTTLRRVGFENDAEKVTEIGAGNGTEKVAEKLVADGHQHIAIYSPSFVADCLETTDELGHELANDVEEWGGTLYPIECLNMDEQWCHDFARYTFTQAEGSAQQKEDLEYQMRPEDYAQMAPQVMNEGGD